METKNPPVAGFLFPLYLIVFEKITLLNYE
jgi:hypothetical protein